MERKARPVRRCGTSGFTLIELLVVVGIFAVMAAVSVPRISEYIKTYKIRGATQQVAGAIQDARTRAVMRNAKSGISFAVVSPKSYRIIIEDDLKEGGSDDAKLGELGYLPGNVEFAVNPDGVRTTGVKFTGLGALERLKPYAYPNPCRSYEVATSCTDDADGRGFGLLADGRAVLRLADPHTGLKRDIEIAPGGRVLQVEGWAQ